MRYLGWYGDYCTVVSLLSFLPPSARHALSTLDDDCMDDLVVTGWICPECKDEFANPRELEQHFEQNHGAENGIEPRQRIGSTSVRAPRKISGGSGSGSPDVVPIEFPKQGLGAKSSDRRFTTQQNSIR